MLDRLAKKLFGDRKARSTIERFFRDVPVYQNDKGRVLHYVGIGSMYLTPAEILIYHLLRKNGFEVDYLIYDESVPINEVITLDRENSIGKDAFWSKSVKTARALLKAGKVPYQSIPITEKAISIASELADLDQVLQFKLDDIDFGSIVTGALYRYYKSLNFGDGAEDVAKRMLTTALSNYFCVKDRCEKHDYNYVFFSHGIYITWQPVVEYCKRNNIDFICYDRAKTKGHANFNVNQPSPDWSFDDAWTRYLDRQLTPEETKRVNQYLEERELQSGDVYSYNFSSRAKNVDQVKLRLGIPLNRKCITIFTNLIWDAANVSRDIAFSSALDCIISTIDHFRDRDDVQVVLRSHPAEKVLGTQERYETLVLDHFKSNLPKNVTIISPEDEVNSFTVIDMTSVGVVNTSTVGLEMAIEAKPVLLISETHYRGRGFTHDIQSAMEYFETIETALKKDEIPTAQVDLAKKYFFMMMFLYQQKLPVNYNDNQFDGYCCERFADLPPDNTLSSIIQKVAENDLRLVTWK